MDNLIILFLKLLQKSMSVEDIRQFALNSNIDEEKFFLTFKAGEILHNDIIKWDSEKKQRQLFKRI